MNKISRTPHPKPIAAYFTLCFLCFSSHRCKATRPQAVSGAASRFRSGNCRNGPACWDVCRRAAQR